MTDYTEGVSGFKLEGDWSDIVAHGEKIAQALKETDQVKDEYPEAFEEYNDWRPKVEENIDKDISEKTAEKASIPESEVEKETESPKEEVKEAGKKITKGTKEADKPNEAAKEISSSFMFLARALTVFARKSMRQSEKVVYQNFMTVLSPYYFDNELVSANLTKQSDGDYILEININNDSLKSEVSDILKEYESAESWRIASPVETSTVKEAEGVDVPDVEEEITLE